MSPSSPSDLAVTFRSLPRRLDEARGDSPADVADLSAELDRRVAAAASLLGTTPRADAVADAISARHADDWDESTLADLRTTALDVGRLLREIAARSDAGR